LRLPIKTATQARRSHSWTTWIVAGARDCLNGSERLRLTKVGTTCA